MTPHAMLQQAIALLRKVPDFPKPGILFFDLNPVLRDPLVMDYIENAIADY
jgi:adenine phosphoribosyltransferase